MPGRRAQQPPVDNKLCRRCQQHEPAITVRTEPLCRDCFNKYVQTKVVKRMESFRVRHNEPGKERKILLPLSFGTSSLALLHILSLHLKGQAEKTGRTGFKLCVVHIDETGSVDHPNVTSTLENLRQRYPDHEYSIISLSEIATFEDLSTLVLANLGLRAEAQGERNIDDLKNDCFAAFLDSTESATSRADVLQLLQRKLIVHLAKLSDCEAIIWGDSTTRLAERTLAETAKGRGFSLPWIVAAGESPYGIPCYFPMRDLLSKEIAAFVELVEPPLVGLVLEKAPKPAVSTKNTTIDDLMRQYFESVEQDYPSIVANVVKTAGKLQASSLSDVEQQCELCEMPLDGQAPERSRLCYGCIRTLPQGAG